jgi:hypothetical protein
MTVVATQWWLQRVQSQSLSLYSTSIAHWCYRSVGHSPSKQQNVGPTMSQAPSSPWHNVGAQRWIGSLPETTKSNWPNIGNTTLVTRVVPMQVQGWSTKTRLFDSRWFRIGSTLGQSQSKPVSITLSAILKTVGSSLYMRCANQIQSLVYLARTTNPPVLDIHNSLV